MNFEVVLSDLSSKSQEFDGYSVAINSLVDSGKSELNSISGTEISGLYSQVSENLEKLKNGYSKCQEWLTGYINDLNSLESNLAGFNCANIDTPRDFEVGFNDIFSKPVIPTLKDGGDTSANLSLGELGESFSEKSQKIIESAGVVGYPGGSLCAQWISEVFDNAGLGYPGGNADDMFYNWCTTSDRNKIEPGMIIAVPSHTHIPAGQIYGHVGIYMGNGMVRDNIGYIRDISLDEWIDYYSTTYTPQWGWIS